MCKRMGKTSGCLKLINFKCILRAWNCFCSCCFLKPFGPIERINSQSQEPLWITKWSFPFLLLICRRLRNLKMNSNSLILAFLAQTNDEFKRGVTCYYSKVWTLTQIFDNFQQNSKNSENCKITQIKAKNINLPFCYHWTRKIIQKCSYLPKDVKCWDLKVFFEWEELIGCLHSKGEGHEIFPLHCCSL